MLVIRKRLQGDILAVMFVDIIDNARDALIVIARLGLFSFRAFNLEIGDQL